MGTCQVDGCCWVVGERRGGGEGANVSDRGYVVGGRARLQGMNAGSGATVRGLVERISGGGLILSFGLNLFSPLPFVPAIRCLS